MLLGRIRVQVGSRGRSRLELEARVRISGSLGTPPGMCERRWMGVEGSEGSREVLIERATWIVCVMVEQTSHGGGLHWGLAAHTART